MKDIDGGDQVTHVDGIEGAAEDADARRGSGSGSGCGSGAQVPASREMTGAKASISASWTTM